MTKVFVKAAELKLVNGGYVVTVNDETPVNNAEFVAAQKRAEYIITFAEKAKGKDFVGKTADSVESVKSEVESALAKKDTQYVEAPKEVKQNLTKKLQKEALAFINFKEDTSKAEKVNKFLQEFNVINEFEEFGLFFEQDIVKLNKIYTMDQIVAAVKEVINIIE